MPRRSCATDQIQFKTLFFEVEVTSNQKSVDARHYEWIYEMSKIDTISESFKDDEYEPFIRHIRFPYFKNLNSGLRLDFLFPVTAVVGPNGSNKSSVLRAISCCPHFQNLGDHWFSTEVDPIDDSGQRPRYIFGYIDQHSGQTVEVLQLRIRKEKDPDYWEPSRPIVKDGMRRLPPLKPGEAVPGRLKTRWQGIKKEVVLLDFRSEISAFDKLFYHGTMSENFRNRPAKEHIRKRSILLKQVISQNLKSLKPYRSKKEMIFLNEMLPTSYVRNISTIIGRSYKSIRLVEHTLFENKSFTAILETNDLSYSEAFAGSGEFAIIMLVYKILKAPHHSLIVIDEPEVSLHPGAQTKLMEFLINQCDSKKHQIVIGTHSKHIIDGMPPEAVILLQQDQNTGRIVASQNIKPSEAFFHLGLTSESKTKIFVEDELAVAVVKKSLRLLGDAAFSQFEVLAHPGGAGTLATRLIPSQFQSGDTTSLYLLDGDQKPPLALKHPDKILLADHEGIIANLSLFSNNSKIHLALNGGNDPTLPQKKKDIERNFLKYAIEHTGYLPDKNPEDFVWARMTKDDHTSACDHLETKDRYAKLTKLEKGLSENEYVSSQEILETQVRKLASIPNNDPDIIALSRHLKKFVK